MDLPRRHLVFISHATPEDNEFTKWLGMQLTRNGYQVWSDITKLIGGEVWWNDIEEAIRDHTAKFIFVLSKASNSKPGTRNELHLALAVERQQNIKDFIIPLHVDSQLPYAEINIQIGNRNAVPFTQGWAEGLTKVLRKLNEDAVYRDTSQYSPATVATWWQSHVDGHDVLHREPSTYISNWYPVSDMPSTMNVINLAGKSYNHDNDGFPSHRIGQDVFSFASPKDLLLAGHYSQEIELSKILENTVSQEIPLSVSILRNVFVRLLRMGLEDAMKQAGLPSYLMSNDKQCFYFTNDLLDGKKRISFDIPGCISGQRGLTGRFGKYRWHFGLSADFRLIPMPRYTIRSHVLFSDDGKNIWDSKSRLHQARRSACKGWWNGRWRDMMLLAIAWISQRQATGEPLVRVPLSNDTNFAMSITPVQFESPVAYKDTEVVQEDIDDSSLELENDETIDEEMADSNE